MLFRSMKEICYKGAVLPRALDMSPVYLEFSDGSVWRIPRQIIIDSRDSYYAETVDDLLDGDYGNATPDEDLADWLFGDMNWKDVADYAVQVAGPRPPDYEEMFPDAEISFKERR